MSSNVPFVFVFTFAHASFVLQMIHDVPFQNSVTGNLMIPENIFLAYLNVQPKSVVFPGLMFAVRILALVCLTLNNR